MRHSPRQRALVACVFVFLLGVLGSLRFATLALAQDDTTGDRATSFEAVEGSPKEDVPGGPLLVAAYAFVLVLLIGYAARLGSMQAKTTREVARLARVLEARGPKE